MDTFAQSQVTEIIKECLEKKHGGNKSKMAAWLGGVTSASVANWAEGHNAPAWVVMKIFDHWEDIREHFLVDAQTPISVVDPEKDDLMNRIASLLEDQFMFDYMSKEVQTFKTYGERLMQKIEESSAAHDPKADYGSEKKKPRRRA